LRCLLDCAHFLQRRKRRNQVAQHLFAAGQTFEGLQQIVLRTVATQHFQRFAVVLAGALGFVQGLVATRHLGERQTLIGPHPELTITGHQREQRFGGLAVAPGGLQHDGVVTPGHQGQPHLAGRRALLGEFQPVPQVRFDLRSWLDIVRRVFESTADAVEVGQPRVALFVTCGAAVQQLAGLFQARQRVLVSAENRRDDAHLPQDTPAAQVITGSACQGLGVLERGQCGFVITSGSQRARRVDERIAGTALQTCSLEQLTGLDRGGEGLQLFTPVAVHERLRQKQLGALDPGSAAQSLMGQLLGFVVRSALDERADQIGGGFAHHLDFTRLASAGGGGGLPATSHMAFPPGPVAGPGQ
jgi:hypothetical protein